MRIIFKFRNTLSAFTRRLLYALCWVQNMRGS